MPGSSTWVSVWIPAARKVSRATTLRLGSPPFHPRGPTTCRAARSGFPAAFPASRAGWSGPAPGSALSTATAASSDGRHLRAWSKHPSVRPRATGASGNNGAGGGSRRRPPPVPAEQMHAGRFVQAPDSVARGGRQAQLRSPLPSTAAVMSGAAPGRATTPWRSRADLPRSDGVPDPPVRESGSKQGRYPRHGADMSEVRGESPSVHSTAIPRPLRHPPAGLCGQPAAWIFPVFGVGRRRSPRNTPGAASVLAAKGAGESPRRSKM